MLTYYDMAVTQILQSRLEYFGKRSFAAAAPTLWNNLPLNIKQAPSVDIFKSRVKTHLFQLAYFM